MTFWNNILTFRRPSSSTSTSSTSDSIDSSSSGSLNLNTRSGSSKRFRKGRRDLFIGTACDSPFECSFESGTMNVNMQSPVGMERNSLGKDTGFPEPLSLDRNTTLPHPEADTSPYATLESTDIDLQRTHSRRSLLRHYSRHKGSHLSVPSYVHVPSYDNIEYADGSHENGGSDGDVKTITNASERRDDGLIDPPKTVEEYVEMEDRDEQGYRAGERKKGVLRKLNLHKV